MSRRFLILIGPTRTGTTSLFRYLARDRAHFAASTVKETNHFLPAGAEVAGSDAAGSDGAGPDDDGITGEARPTREAYLRLFPAGDDRVLLEASPLYFAAAARSAPDLRGALAGDDVRVLATLREPVDRFVSLYQHVVTKRNVEDAPVPFEAFVDDALGRRDRLGHATRADANLHAFNEGRYAELLAAWSDALGAERVRAVSFDALADDDLRPAALAELYAWLGLDDASHLATPYGTENRSRPVRSKGIHAAAMRLNDRLEPLFNRLPWLRDLARSIYYRANEDAGARGDYPRAVLDRLRSAYAEANRGLPDAWRRHRLGALPPWCAPD